MNRIHLGNRVFTEKHGKVKLAHGPYSGHLCPTVTYMRSFDGLRVHRIVHIPHELAAFDHAMWMERRTRVTNRQHARAIRDGLNEPVLVSDDAPPCVSAVSATLQIGTECGVELYYNEKGQLSCASYGSDTPAPSRRTSTERIRSYRRITRRDGAQSARLMC